MRPELHIDFETRSILNLKQVGVHVYAAHPSTGVWCACATIIDERGETEVDWLPDHEPVPQELLDVLARKPLVIAHNAGFEFELWTAKLEPLGLPCPPFEDFDCTAAMAAALALPRDLDGAAMAMGLEVRKDAAGKRLMLQMCRPRRITNGVAEWWDVPEKVARLVAYCRQDTRVEVQLHRKVRPLSAGERRIWQLDHIINRRGVQVDLASVRAAKRIVTVEVDKLNAELGQLTDQRVRKVTNHAFLGQWLRDQGLDVEGVGKAVVKDQLASGDLTPKVRRVLEIRQEAARSSLAKLDAFELRTSADGRARGNLMYHGASTGRFSGVGIQLQNLLRPWMKYRDLAAAVEAFGLPDAASWLTLWGKPLDVIANAMRLLIVAPEGHDLFISDFANIEGRVLAWLAGELWKLRAFEAYDAGQGADIYLIAAADIFGVALESLDKDSPERQVGKVSELAQGFQGGHGAWISMGANYGIKPEAIAPVVRAATSDERWEEAADRYDPRNRYDLDLLCWTALRLVIDGWRGAHPATVKFWRALENAATLAVRRPGMPVPCGKVAFVSTGSMLWCKLPSGRLLAYADPKIHEVVTPWGEVRDAVTYMGVNSVTRRWERHKAYGGHWAENVTQAAARDVMCAAMLRVESKGWPLVLTVHDELVAEIAKRLGITKAMFHAVMLEREDWFSDLPVAAATDVSPRYKK